MVKSSFISPCDVVSIPIEMKALFYDIHPAGWAGAYLLKRFWKGALLSRLNGLVLREVPLPELPTDEWVICRTLLGGICGSDLAIIAQRQPVDSILQCYTTLPMIPGHENVAVVEKVGSAVDSRWIGKRVCVEPTLCCKVRGIYPPCKPCSQGNFGACENFSADGEGTSHLPPGTSLGYCGAVGGSWAEYFLAHVSQLVEVPENLTDTQAILTDPLACSLHAVLRADLTDAKHVLVYGAGILGLGVVWALRQIGFDGKIDIIARYPHQGQIAKEFGADDILYLPVDKQERFRIIAKKTDGIVKQARFGNLMLSGGYDVVFECVGAEETIEEALIWTAARGQVILVGTGHGRGTDMTPIWFRELTVIGAYGRSVERYRGREIQTYQLVHELMLQSTCDVSTLLTGTFPLHEYKLALKTALDKGKNKSIKVAFKFEFPT